jgi:hypothetical protein
MYRQVRGVHHVCLETLTYRTEKGGRHAEASHMRLLMDCAQICQTSADFIIRKSELGEKACYFCATSATGARRPARASRATNRCGAVPRSAGNAPRCARKPRPAAAKEARLVPGPVRRRSIIQPASRPESPIRFPAIGPIAWPLTGTEGAPRR